MQEVIKFLNLPPASVHTGEVWRVLECRVDSICYKREDEGYYRSDRTRWVKTAFVVDSIADLSNPPGGMCRVTNIFVNPQTGKLVVEFDTTPV